MSNEAEPMPGYHHHKSQLFVNGKVVCGAGGTGFVYNSNNVIPKEPQKSLPSDAMQDCRFRPQSKRFHIKNLHSTDYELGGLSTSTTSWLRKSYPKKQHFVRGQMAGASSSNHLIYGTDELLHQARLREEVNNPRGFLYGTEAATNVGKPSPAPRPNNVLWLEEKTETDVAKHKKLANTKDEYLARYYEEKAKKMQAAKEEQKKDFEELKRYAPWGRPGGGAPMFGHCDKPYTHRTKNVRALIEEHDQSFGGQSGGGAPNRSESGRVHAAYKTDPELRFPRHASRPVVEPILRYGGRNEDYKKELEFSIEDSRARKQVQRQRSFKDELQHINTDPFGREGGGAPRRTGQGSVIAGFPTTLSQDIQELRLVDRRHQHAFSQVSQKPVDSGCETTLYYPWGRGHGNPPAFDHQGRMIRAPQQNQTNDLEGIGIKVGRPGAGAPNVDSHGNKRVKKAQTLAKTTNGQNIQRDFSPKGETYNPWGKSGAGAPIKDHEGQIQTRTAGRVIHDANDVPNSLDSRAKHLYLTTLQRMAEETKERRKAEHDDLLTAPEKDVASWLGTGTVGQLIHDPVTKEIVAQKKQTSDVTSQALNIRRQKNEKSGEYHVDLEIQARERHQQRKHNQEEERIKSLEHLKTMDSMWGRPGAGAPLKKEHADFAKKQKLGIVPMDSTFTYREA